MAESQEAFDYDDTMGEALGAALSRPRLAMYLRQALDDLPFALHLYLWNARLSKAFLFPLQVVEVVTRNSMHRELCKAYGGPNWILDPPFGLTEGGQLALDRAKIRVAKERQGSYRPLPTPDDYVAALTLDFWSNLFRQDYDSVWSAPGLLRAVFPNLPPAHGRRSVQNTVRAVNDLRNRVAHHEPIHQDEQLSGKHDTILDLIGWSCLETKRWVQRHSTVLSVLRNPPTKSSTLPGWVLSSMNIRAPVVLDPAEPLLSAMPKVSSARPSLGLVADQASSPPYRVLFAKDFLNYVTTAAGQLEGTVDLSEHSVADVLAATPLVALGQISRSATTGDARALFFPRKTAEVKRPRVLLVTGEDGPESVIGVIVHPEIRY